MAGASLTSATSPRNTGVLALTTTYFRALGRAPNPIHNREPQRYEAAIAAHPQLKPAPGDGGLWAQNTVQLRKAGATIIAGSHDAGGQRVLGWGSHMEMEAYFVPAGADPLPGIDLQGIGLVASAIEFVP